MTFVITDPCIGTMDQACVEVCPVDCIHFDEGADQMLFIDPVECIDCGACQPACPVSAIFPEGDVPDDQQVFIEINALWYQDKAAARGQIPGGGGGGAAAPAPAAASAEPAAESEAGEAAAASAAAGDEAPAPAAAAAPAAATAPAAEAAPPPFTQVPAGATATGPMQQPLSAVSLGAIVVFAAAFYTMWVFPGPTWVNIDFGDPITILGLEWDGRIGISIIVLLPLALLAALLFLRSEAMRLSRFGTANEPALLDWRQGNWFNRRRSEESRLHYLAEAVERIASERFPFPDGEHPEYATHVNMPEPRIAVEIGGGDKLFPDIVVTTEPGTKPRMLVMVETPETVSRDQAHHVWKRLENRSAPLYLYVPAGTVSRARTYIKDVDLKNYRLRSWRRVGDKGVIVRDA